MRVFVIFLTYFKMEKNLFLLIIVFCVQITCTFNTQAPTGRPANENQFPYMISLQRLSEIHSANRGHRCEGVLVTLQHALTAAFCVGVFEGSVETLTPADLDEFRVFAGSVFLTNDTSADRVRRIANIIIHPEYNRTISRHLNNIGVIVLGTPFQSNTASQISVRDIGTTLDYLQCTAVGWGRGNRLMHTAVLAVNDTTCNIVIRPLEPKMVCASHSMFVCWEDIGSPLICHNSLVGIQVDDMCTPIFRLHIRVSNYTRWINEVVALPIPELGPEPSTVPPPTTTTTLAPGAAFKFQPGITLLALAVVFTVNRQFHKLRM